MQVICFQVHWLKKSMLACGKNMPKNNQFSIFCPEKINITQKKSAQISRKFTQKIKICPVTYPAKVDLFKLRISRF